MIDEKDISKKLGRDMKSPIRIGSLNELGIDAASFLALYKPKFEHLQDDVYLVKTNQIAFLKKCFPNEESQIEQGHKDYYTGALPFSHFSRWVDRLDTEQKRELGKLSLVTRQRNISSFVIDLTSDGAVITRLHETGFGQEVEDSRSWERVFKQATSGDVENEQFKLLLTKIALLVKSIHTDAQKLQITSHFMRTITEENVPGENSPEGVHEDGAQYIVSALVINRHNIDGAESQIFELSSEGTNEMIYNKVLAPGEFIFQADTGEEITFDNDLWHYVTPIHAVDSNSQGIRDIIGFDIDIVD